MPVKKAKTPKVETPEDVYIVCVGNQTVYYFNEAMFLEFINQRRAAPGERREITFLTEFPLPRPGRYNIDYNESANERHLYGQDSKSRYFGRYCPFQSGNWPTNGVLVLKNGKIFVPPIEEVTRVVREYVIHSTPTATQNFVKASDATGTPAKKARSRK